MGINRRALLKAGGVLAAGAVGTMLPGVAFADGTDGSQQTVTVTGRFEPGAPDWYYLPVEVPSGVARLDVVYGYDKPPVPPGEVGNALDFGVFGPAGHELGNHQGFRGWSGGARDRFTLSASDATPGYLPGPIDPGTWHVVLGPYTVAEQGLDYRVDITLTFGPPGEPFQVKPAPSFAPARRRGRDWYRGDGHLHTIYSDGRRTPDQLVAAARAAGLDFIVSTEHNTPSASLQWGRHATEDLLILNGEEVTTRSGHWPAWHLPVGRWIDWRYRDTEPDEFGHFVNEVHSVGGLVVAAHPFAPCLGCAFEFRYDEVDAIEVWNGPWTPDDEKTVQTWDAMLRQGRWIPAVGNSDAHSEPQVVGLPHNVVLAEDLFGPFLFEALKAGRNWIAESTEVQLSMTVTDGRHRAELGETLRTSRPVTVQVETKGAPGTEVRVIDQTGIRHRDQESATWTTSPADSDWVRVEVRRGDQMVALTNPVFLQ